MMYTSGEPIGIIFLLLLLSTPTQAMIGYDCGGEGLNITTLSLTDIGNCQLDDWEPQAEETYVQLLQISEFDHTEAVQCRIEVDRTIYHCGMHSHASAVHNGKHEYIQEISGQKCKTLHSNGAIFLGHNALITGIKPNITTSRSITLAGIIEVNGRCSGTQFSDPYGTWDNVVVQASIKITTRKLELPIKYSTNEIILPAGVRCLATDWECIDADGMATFWTTVPRDNCQTQKYDVLYEGIAHKLTQPKSPTIYTVTTRDTTFALAETSETNICGYKVMQTEHPKLLILETKKGRTFKTTAKISVDNIDIFSYVNSKFIYVEKHQNTQLTQLYRDIMKQKCVLEKQILENALSLSSISPDEMAYRLMRKPGYTALTAGEVIYIIKCVPTSVKVRQTKECYTELPVLHGNRSYFLSPRSRILTKGGTIRECNEMLPSMYQVDGTWFKFLPKAAEAIPPSIIQPLTQPKWKYVSPANLATSGIYSEKDLERLRNHIMFPIEKPSMLDTLAQGAMGKPIPPGSVSIYNLMDEDSLKKIAEDTVSKLWQGFITFGSASAGVLAIMLLIRLAKLIVGSIIRGYALHSIYGWSLHLLGALWSSITHLLLQIGRKKTRGPTNNTNNGDRVTGEIPLEDVTSDLI